MTWNADADGPRWRLALEDAPDAALALLTAVHTRQGLGDGMVTLVMLCRHLRETGAHPQEALRALGPAAVAGLHHLGWTPPAASAAAAPAPVSSDASTSETDLVDTADVEGATLAAPDPTDTPSQLIMDGTNPDDVTAAPGRLDEQGRLYGARHEKALAAGTAEVAELLEGMALALEEGARWPMGAKDSAGRSRLMDRLEESVAAGLGQDDANRSPLLTPMRLRVAACSLALCVARRERDEPLQRRASSLLAAVLMGEPRRGIRAALAAALMAWPELPEEVGEALLATLAELMPTAPPYAEWEAVRPSSQPLWVRHVVYAPEFRMVKDGYEAAGFIRATERPLQFARDVPGGRSLRVELRRAHASAVLTDENAPQEVLLLSGLAMALEPAPPGLPRVVVAAFRRDPFGVPRVADRFPRDHVVGVARGDKPMDDVGFFHSLLYALARREPYAIIRHNTREAAPLLSLRALWPHEPGALRACGGAPAPFSSDASALTEHRLTWAVPRPSRRPIDLKWRNDAPDTTSYLALEVATALAGTPLRREDLPVLEPGGYHEGLPDVEITVGAALWRTSITRGLCAQAEEALAALVTLYVHARRAELLGEKPRAALLLGAAQATRIATLHCATGDQAWDVIQAVLRHAGLPSSMKWEHLLAASMDQGALLSLKMAHARWLDG